MNKIIFDKYLDESKPSDDDMYPKSLKLPPKEEEKDVPFLGMMMLERHKGAM
jgi:hypothetical protein